MPAFCIHVHFLIKEYVVVMKKFQPGREMLTAEIKTRPVILHREVEASHIPFQAVVDRVIILPITVPLVTKT